ncbi:hypothetical protein CK203_083659, partial [Vitis vinifera]
MKLNLSKCVFEVSVGKFLGFMVTQRGIEVNPDQIKVVMETSAPSSKKELQRLTGRLVALGRFIVHSGDPQQPPRLIESSKNGWWTLHVDGASRTSRSKVGLLLRLPTGEQLEQAIRLGFPASNNEAKYEATLSG